MEVSIIVGKEKISIMSEKQYASHNVSVLIYHFVLPTKYRRVMIDEHVNEIIAETCVEMIIPLFESH